jgi:hypothetical protein
MILAKLSRFLRMSCSNLATEVPVAEFAALEVLGGSQGRERHFGDF